MTRCTNPRGSRPSGPSPHPPASLPRRTLLISNGIVANGGMALARPSRIQPAPHFCEIPTNTVAKQNAMNMNPWTLPPIDTITSVVFVTYLRNMPMSRRAHVMASPMANSEKKRCGVTPPSFPLTTAAAFLICIARIHCSARGHHAQPVVTTRLNPGASSRKHRGPVGSAGHGLGSLSPRHRAQPAPSLSCDDGCAW